MTDKPWKDGELLHTLYWEKGMTDAEIAVEFGCSQSTVTTWRKKHGIEGRRLSNTPASFYTIGRGYEFWNSTTPADYDECREEYVRVHRLLAVAKYGFDAVADKAVHHKNEVPWDNRPENIELMTHEDHGRMHATDADVERDELGRWC